MSKIRIVGAIASETGVTLYLENGAEVNLRKDRYRTKAILDDCVERLARKEVVELDTDTFSVEARIEKKTNGFIRFFKEKLTKIVDKVTGNTTEEWVPHVETAPLRSDVKDVVKGVKPAQAAEGAVRTVAVVGGVKVPHVENLEKQMDYAAYADVKGFTKFMERLAAVVKDRKHTADELLTFMQRGDLPIADDGSIVAYKVLKTGRGAWVDCHSGNVTQRLGSHVSMPINRVDDSKRTQCSTGLHIARRGYLGGFSGNIITLVKVAPEDVVAVPSGEPDKMRAAAYHIVAELPPDVHALLRSNKPMTSNEKAAKILADVIAGHHVGIIERVVINGTYGSNIVVTPANGNAAPSSHLGAQVVALDDETNKVSVKELRQTINKVEAEPGPDFKNDLAAAINTKPAEKPKESKKRATATTTPKKAKSAPVTPAEPATPTPVAGKPVFDHPKAAQVLQLVAQDKSFRTIEKELGVCRKTIRKIVDAGVTK